MGITVYFADHTGYILNKNVSYEGPSITDVVLDAAQRVFRSLDPDKICSVSAWEGEHLVQIQMFEKVIDLASRNIYSIEVLIKHRTGMTVLLLTPSFAIHRSFNERAPKSPKELIQKLKICNISPEMILEFVCADSEGYQDLDWEDDRKLMDVIILFVVASDVELSLHKSDLIPQKALIELKINEVMKKNVSLIEKINKINEFTNEDWKTLMEKFFVPFMSLKPRILLTQGQIRNYLDWLLRQLEGSPALTLEDKYIEELEAKCIEIRKEEDAARRNRLYNFHCKSFPRRMLKQLWIKMKSYEVVVHVRLPDYVEHRVKVPMRMVVFVHDLIRIVLANEKYEAKHVQDAFLFDGDDAIHLDVDDVVHPEYDYYLRLKKVKSRCFVIDQNGVYLYNFEFDDLNADVSSVALPVVNEHNIRIDNVLGAFYVEAGHLVRLHNYDTVETLTEMFLQIYKGPNTEFNGGECSIIPKRMKMTKEEILSVIKKPESFMRNISSKRHVDRGDLIRIALHICQRTFEFLSRDVYEGEWEKIYRSFFKFSKNLLNRLRMTECRIRGCNVDYFTFAWNIVYKDAYHKRLSIIKSLSSKHVDLLDFMPEEVYFSSHMGPGDAKLSKHEELRNCYVLDHKCVWIDEFSFVHSVRPQTLLDMVYKRIGVTERELIWFGTSDGRGRSKHSPEAFGEHNMFIQLVKHTLPENFDPALPIERVPKDFPKDIEELAKRYDLSVEQINNGTPSTSVCISILHGIMFCLFEANPFRMPLKEEVEMCLDALVKPEHQDIMYMCYNTEAERRSLLDNELIHFPGIWENKRNGVMLDIENNMGEICFIPLALQRRSDYPDVITLDESSEDLIGTLGHVISHPEGSQMEEDVNEDKENQPASKATVMYKNQGRNELAVI